MDFSKIDLHQALIKVKQQQAAPSIVEEVYQLLNDEVEKERAIVGRIFKGNVPLSNRLEELDAEHIFDIQQIKRLCIRYRLRFLDASLFKGEVPYEAIQKVKSLEARLGVEITDFKVIASKELFKLEDKDSDPMLFVKLTENKFYFIHKWGKDMSLWRSLAAYPFRNVETMFFTLLAIAVLFSTAVPTPSTLWYIFLIVHSFIAICGVACMLVMMFRENFSDTEWDSKYLS